MAGRMGWLCMRRAEPASWAKLRQIGRKSLEQRFKSPKPGPTLP